MFEGYWNEFIKQSFARCKQTAFDEEVVYDLFKSTAQGETEATYQLALRFRNGQGVEQNVVISIELLQAAAKQDHTQAKSMLGTCYQQGEILPEEPKDAFYWLPAAKAGDKLAIFQLITCIKHGVGIAKNQRQSYLLFNHLSEQGFAKAAYQIGLCFKIGEGCRQNLTMARDYFLLAAFGEQRCYGYKIHDIDALYELANVKLEQVRKLANVDKNNFYFLEYNFRNFQSISEEQTRKIRSGLYDVFKDFQHAANNGHIKSKFMLAIFYKFGLGTSTNLAKAIELLQEISGLGLVDAQIELGKCLQYGIGLTKDSRQAAIWYKKAGIQEDEEAKSSGSRGTAHSDSAESHQKYTVKRLQKLARGGDPEAQLELALCYQNGKEVKYNSQLANYWLRASAKFGNAEAQFRYALQFYKRGESSNQYIAFIWFYLAALQDHSEAHYYLGRYLSDEIGVHHPVSLSFLKRLAFNDILFIRNVCFYGHGWDKSFFWFGEQPPYTDFFHSSVFISNTSIRTVDSELIDREKRDVEHFTVVTETVLSRVNARITRYKALGHEKAIEHFKKAFSLGCKQSSFELGCYFEKKGEFKEAFGYFIDAAKQELGKAQLKVFNCYKHEQGVGKNLKEAIRWLINAAKNNDADAQYQLAEHYRDNKNVAQAEKKYEHWFLKSANNGDARAQLQQAYICLRRARDVRETSPAHSWQCRISKRSGLEKRNYSMEVSLPIVSANSYKIEKKAFEWFYKAAMQGLAEAEYNVGLCYKNAIGVTKDNRQAAIWFEKSALQHFTKAELSLADCYINGWGVEQDFDTAIKWLRGVENKNPRDASFLFGKCCLKMKEVRQQEFNSLFECDSKGLLLIEIDSFKCFLKSAKLDHADASYKVGECYEHEFGVERNLAWAVYWYKTADKLGNQFAKKAYTNLLKKVSGKALYQLGKSLLDSSNNPEDIESAYEWLKLSESKGCSEARNIFKEYQYKQERSNGFTALEAKNYVSAIEHFTVAIEFKPKDSILLLQRGKTFEALAESKSSNLERNEFYSLACKDYEAGLFLNMLDKESIIALQLVKGKISRLKRDNQKLIMGSITKSSTDYKGNRFDAKSEQKRSFSNGSNEEKLIEVEHAINKLGGTVRIHAEILITHDQELKVFRMMLSELILKVDLVKEKLRILTRLIERKFYNLEKKWDEFKNEQQQDYIQRMTNMEDSLLQREEHTKNQAVRMFRRIQRLIKESKDVTKQKKINTKLILLSQKVDSTSEDVIVLKKHQQILIEEYNKNLAVQMEKFAIEKNPKLRIFYRLFQLRMNELFLAHKALNSGIIQGTNQNSKAVTGTRKALDFIGNFVSFIPGVKVITTVLSELTQAFQDEKNSKKHKKISNIAVSITQMDEIVERAARLITRSYAQQILHLANSSIKTFADCGVLRVLSQIELGKLDADNNDIAKSMLDAICSSKLKQGTLSLKEKELKTLLKGEKWSVSSAYRLPGICAANGELYASDSKKECDHRKYGFRFASPEGAAKLGFKKKDIKPVKLLQDSEESYEPKKLLAYFRVPKVNFDKIKQAVDEDEQISAFTMKKQIEFVSKFGQVKEAAIRFTKNIGI